MRLLLTLVIINLLLAGNAFAAAMSADDFLPPIQAASPEQEQQTEQIAQPEAVKEEKGASGEQVVSAATAQDAINAAVKHTAVGGGCEEVKFPSGFGFVASGVATYSSVMPNPTATLMDQRKAYQIAYLNAKKELARHLNGMSTTSKEQLLNEFKIVTTDTDTLANVSETMGENISELINGLLKGYVVYNVNDDQSDNTGTVTVTIVTTPKTLGKANRVDSSAMSTGNVREGLNSVLSEIANGLLPPVGGKIISVPQSGELAFVGFGSAVVPDNPDKGVHAKLVLNAQKIAQMRARSALCGIILGDEIEASASLDAPTQSMSKQFDEVQQDDPLEQAKDKAEINKLDAQLKTFQSNQLTKEQISSLRSGVLPPGVNVKTFMNPENTLAEAVAVYLPSATARASKAGQDMKASQIVKNPAKGGQSTQQGINGGNAGQMPARGASGQVTNDADL